MSKITFGDKSYLNLNGDIPETNKITDTNINEIKTVVNDNYDEYVDNLFYKSGDVIELGQSVQDITKMFVMPGFITSGSKSLYLTIITPKRLDNITSAEIDSLDAESRSVDGYMLTSGFVDYIDDIYSFVVGISGPNSILVRVNRTTVFTTTGGTTITNNTPIVLSGSIRIILH